MWAPVVVVGLCHVASCAGTPSGTCESDLSLCDDAGGEPVDAGDEPIDAGDEQPDGGGPFESLSFGRTVLDENFTAEGAGVADLDDDGVNDIIAGPWVYWGPDFAERTAYRNVFVFPVRNYSDNFFVFPYDFGDDGAMDFLVVGFPGQAAIWYENPLNRDDPWTPHVVFDIVDTESPDFVDVTGDGVPELVCATLGKLGYASFDVDNPDVTWTFQAISPDGPFQRFTHGLGTGDVNGDGRVDVIEKRGYWTQPAEVGVLWTFHAHDFGVGGGQMFTYDVDDDGDIDVVTTHAAHGAGLSWYEQTTPNAFVRQIISGATPDEGETEVVLHEAHALALVDIDGDGVKDLVAGDRHWGHAPDDQNAPFDTVANIWWFRLSRTANGAEFTAHLIDDDSGVGTQLPVADVDGDGRIDVVIANKKGHFYFKNVAE